MAHPVQLGRRAALALPLALTGCGLFNGDWFGKEKKPLPGKREPLLNNVGVLAPAHGLPPVALPPPVRNAAWMQAGGNPAHDMGQLAAPATLRVVWTSSIGEGGGYRNKVLAQPVVARGVVYTMDVAARVSAFELSSGNRLWRVPTRPRHARSTNVGGGLGIADDTLYAVNGLGSLVALDLRSGKERWRKELNVPLRSEPLIAVGRVFVTSSDDRLFALDAAGGQHLWDYQAQSTMANMLGRPAPAFSDGIVVAGFGSGELSALRADAGTVVWTDVLASAGGGRFADIASIRGRPAISEGRVFATGMGGVTLALDLHAGRRLWERDVAGQDSPWVAGDWLFVITLDQMLACLHLADGGVAWTSQLPAYHNPKKQSGPLSWYGPALAGNRLVVSGTDKLALSVNPYTGALLGKQRLPAPAAAVQPVVVEDTLLLVAEDGRLMALQ